MNKSEPEDKRISKLTFFDQLQFLNDIDSLMLDLTIIKVSNIPHLTDSYVEVTFNKETVQTLLIKNSQNPIWSEKILIPLRGMEAQEYLSAHFVIELKDKTKDVLGTLKFKVGDVEYEKDEFWSEKFENTDITVEFKTKSCRRKQVLVQDHLKFLDNLNKMELDIILMGVQNLPDPYECFARVSFHEAFYQTLNSKQENTIKWELPMRFSMANLSLTEYFHETIKFEVLEKNTNNLIGTFNLPIGDVEYKNNDIFTEVLHTSKLKSTIQFKAQVKDLEYLQFQPLQVQTLKKVQVIDQFKFLDKLEKLHLYVRVNELKGVKDAGQYFVKVLTYKVCHGTSQQDISNLNDSEVDNYFKQLVTFQLFKNRQFVSDFTIKLMDIDYNIIEKLEEQFVNSDITCVFETLIHE
jgi:hypothetical protein